MLRQTENVGEDNINRGGNINTTEQISGRLLRVTSKTNSIIEWIGEHYLILILKQLLIKGQRDGTKDH